MERETFARHFADAAIAARDFARKYVLEALPEALCFRVRLNQSHDATASAELKLFPDDGGRVFDDLAADEAIDVLWRDGLVPQWIDIAVIGETGEATRLELRACGRFTADERRLYYRQTSVAPFGVKSPTLPYPYVEGERFSLYHHASCRSLDDVARAQSHAHDVRFLELEGDVFDDAALERMEFPRLEVLSMHRVRARGTGLGSLERMPKLRVLRLQSTAEELDLARVRDRIEQLEIIKPPRA